MKYAVLCLLIALLLSAGASSASTEQVKVIVPGSVICNTEAYAMIKLLDGNMNCLSGKENNIYISIRNNQTYIIQNEHPYENAIGLYEFKFVPSMVGEYVIVASYENSSGVGIFISVFNVANNMTEQQKRVEVLLGSEHQEREDMTRQALYLIATLGATYQNLSNTQEKVTLTDMINNEAIDGALQIIFYSFLTMGIIIVTSIWYTKRRRKKAKPYQTKLHYIR